MTHCSSFLRVPSYHTVSPLLQRLSSKSRWMCSLRPSPWSYSVLPKPITNGYHFYEVGRKSHYISWQCLRIALGVLHSKREVNYLHLRPLKCCWGWFIASYANSVVCLYRTSAHGQSQICSHKHGCLAASPCWSLPGLHRRRIKGWWWWQQLCWWWWRW